MDRAKVIDRNAASDGKTFFRPTINWLLLPPEVLTIVFGNLSIADKGRVALVCSNWRNVVNQPSLWREETARLYLLPPDPALLPFLAKKGIERVSTCINKWLPVSEVARGLSQLRSLTLMPLMTSASCPPSLSSVLILSLPHLTELDLGYHSQMDDFCVKVMATNFPNLISLEFGCRELCFPTNVTDILFGFIRRGFGNLKRLELRGCPQITDDGIKDLVRAHQVEYCGPRLTYLGLRACGRLTNLTLQYLQEEQQSLNVTDDHLKILKLHGCECMDGWGMEHVAKIVSLRELDLNGAVASETGLSLFSESVSRITTLILSTYIYNVTNEGLKHLRKLVHLRNLDFSDNLLITAHGVLSLIPALKQLSSLNLSGCKQISIMDIIVIFSNGSNLQRLVLDQSQISRELLLIVSDYELFPYLRCIIVDNRNIIGEAQMARQSPTRFEDLNRIVQMQLTLRGCFPVV